MSRELVMQYWCDNPSASHAKRSTVSAADTVIVYERSTGKLVELEVCDDCLGDLTEAQMQRLAYDFGREPANPTTDPALCCPILDCKRSSRPFKDTPGRNRHLTRVHPEYSR